MTKAELEQYLTLTRTIERLETELETAVKGKQELAKSLYDRHGRHHVYRVGVGGEIQDLMVFPTRAGTYFFVPRVRWSKESRAAKKQKKHLDLIARAERPMLSTNKPKSGRRAGMDAQAALEKAAGLIPRTKWGLEAQPTAVPTKAEIDAAIDGAVPVTPRRVEITAILERKASPAITSDPADAYDPTEEVPRILPLRLCTVCHQPQDAPSGVACPNHGTPPRAPELSDGTLVIEANDAGSIDCPGNPGQSMDGETYTVGEETQSISVPSVIGSHESVGVFHSVSPIEAGGVAPLSVRDLSPEVAVRHTPESFVPKHHLPIVGDVAQPRLIEPRLLQISEPSDAAAPDGSDPDLDELLRDL